MPVDVTVCPSVPSGSGRTQAEVRATLSYREMTDAAIEAVSRKYGKLPEGNYRLIKHGLGFELVAQFNETPELGGVWLDDS